MDPLLRRCFLKSLAGACSLLLPSILQAAPAAYRPDYVPLSSGSWIQDKNFYLLTALEQDPGVRKELAADGPLADLLKKKRSGADEPALLFSDQEIELVRTELVNALPRIDGLQAVATNHLRPSGYYILLRDKFDSELLGEAWAEAARGINGVIRRYAEGKVDAEIDSPSYDPASEEGRRLIQSAVVRAEEPNRGPAPEMFFEPSLRLALELLALNHRDEASRFEPLAAGENRAAMLTAKSIDWSKYRYASLLVHGVGPELPGVAISEASRANCAAAAALYRQGLAPFIIVSGGYVHPKQTIFCEGVEMKRELRVTYDIPEAAIVLDPQARHTTTNTRNAVRLLFALSAPADKPSLSISNRSHIDYIAGPVFRERCIMTFGYAPGDYGKRISPTAVEFLPSIQSLQMDPMDPLDP